MRAIKFRAWYGPWSDGKMKMVYSGDLTEYDNVGNFPFEGQSLMQFTGLTDKNDVEIYEGDIVRFCVFDGLAQLEGDSPVYFKDGAFRLNRFHPLNDYIRSGTVEVVGNIYEEESE